MSTIDQQNVVQADAVADQTQGSENVTLRRILNGDRFTPTVRFEGGRKVTATYSFRPHDNGPRYEKTTTFDFSNVSEEQLLGFALSSVKITVQSMLRHLTPREMVNPKTYREIDVLKDVINAVRPSGDPATVIQKALLRLSPEARAAILQQIAPKDTEAEAEGDIEVTVANEQQGAAEEQQPVAE